MAEEQFLAMLRLEEEQRSKLEELPGAPVKDRDGSYFPPVPAVVNVGGVSDSFLIVSSLYSQDLEIPPPYDTAIASLGQPDQNPAFFFAYSPVFFADRLPPTLIVHTYADEVIPYNQATALDAAVTESGVQHDLLLYEDTTHYLDAYNPTPATHVVYERVLAFAKEHTR